MKLSIVIIHHNTCDDLARCLESLRSAAPACDHAIVVVDNASSDPQLKAVRERFGGVTWIMSQENLGYARGANRGIAAIRADYYLVLNPDIVARGGAVDALLAYAEAHPKAGIIGPQLLNPDGTIQDSCRRFYTFLTLLLRRTILGKLWRHSAVVDRHLMRDFDHRSERPVDWVLGGCILVRRSAMERTGAMDERFFLYFEDVDWCFRMWRAGFEVHYTPAAQFVHEHRRASAKGAFHRSFWLHLGSLISFYEKWGLLVYLVKKWRGPVTVFLKWLVDMVALSVAFGGAYFLRLALNTWFPEPLYSWSEYRPLWLYACLLTTVTFLVTGRYRRGRSATDKSPLTRLHHVGTVALLLLASTYLSHQQVYSRAVLLLFVPLFAVTATVGEGVFRWLRQRLERGHLSLERSLLVGPPEALQAWLSRSAQPHLLGIDPVGFLTSRLGSEETEPPPLSPGEVPWLGRWQDVLSVVDRYRISQVVFWGQPQPPAADASLLARLHRRRIRLRWRLDEAWLVAAGTRAEPFGGQLSAVLEPGTDAQLSDWLRRGADVVAGILVALVAAVPCLWLCLRGGKRRHGTVTVSCTDPWGEVISYRLVVSRDGRVRSLWWQWWLAWSLVRGRASLVGLRPVADGSIPEWPRALPAEPFWHTGSGRPGLTGSWAVPREKPKPWAFSSGAAWVMMKGMLAVLLRDPGGFGRLPPPDQPPSPEQMESRSFREVE